MITDGKPTCLKIGKRYYKNSFGLDRKITNRCLNLAAQCKKLKIPITTFMIATDPYLQRLFRNLRKQIMAKLSLLRLTDWENLSLKILKAEKGKQFINNQLLQQKSRFTKLCFRFTF